MAVRIRDFNLKKQSQINPLHKVYSGYRLVGKRQVSYRVETLHINSIAQCYKLFGEEDRRQFDEPFFLLKQMFIHPQNDREYVFVQSMRMQRLHPLTFQYLEKANTDRKLLWILRIARLVPILIINKVMHDFSLQKILCDENDNIYLQEFIKHKRQTLTLSQMVKNINKLIARLMEKELKELFDRLQCNLEDNKCHIRIRYKGEKDEIDFQFIEDFSTVQMKSRNIVISYEELKQYSLIIDSLRYNNEFGGIHDSIVLMAEEEEDIQGGESQTKQNCNQQRKGSSKYPYNLVGIIQATLTTESGHTKKIVGSGILVSKNLVITCAHNLKKIMPLVQGGKKEYLFQLREIKNIVFILDGKSSEIEQFRIPEQYLKGKQRDRYDYALLKLAQDVKMDSYIQVIKDYKRTEVDIQLQGHKMQKGQMKSEKFRSNQFQFQQKYISFKSTSEQSPVRGYSGTPILIVAAQNNNNAKYYFMIGIFYGGIPNIKQFYGNVFNDENLKHFKKWELELTKKSIVFRSIFSFQNVISMDTELMTFHNHINQIKFNEDEKKYYFQLFRQIDFSKDINDGIVERKYFEKAINKEKMIECEINKILVNMGSLTSNERRNNWAFMLSLRLFQSWQLEFITFSGSEEGMFIVTIYIIRRLKVFFQRTKVDKQHQSNHRLFCDKLTTIKNLIYEHKITVEKAKKACHLLFKQIPSVLQILPLNQNFKKILLILVHFADSIMYKFEDQTIRTFYVPKLLIYVFIAMQVVYKLAELDRTLLGYLKIFKSIVSIFLDKLKKKSKKDKKYQFNEVLHSFLWGARGMIDSPIVEQMLPTVLRSCNIDKVQLKQEKQIDKLIYKAYFAEWIWKLMIGFWQEIKQNK